MAKNHFKSVDDYIALQPRRVQGVLERVRSAIRKALPEAEEAISYQIPAYKEHGCTVLYFAAWKEHYSIYPAGERLAAAFEKELAPYQLGKGTIRFPLSEPVPVRLIGRIAKYRWKEIRERSKWAATKR